jgi:hypothetical protein
VNLVLSTAIAVIAADWAFRDGWRISGGNGDPPRVLVWVVIVPAAMCIARWLRGEDG